jgi:hypothetical protein
MSGTGKNSDTNTERAVDAPSNNKHQVSLQGIEEQETGIQSNVTVAESATDSSATQLSSSLASDSTITTSTSDQSSLTHYIDELISKKTHYIEIQMTMIQGELERTTLTNNMRFHNLGVTLSGLQKDNSSHSNALNALNKMDVILGLLATKNG